MNTVIAYGAFGMALEVWEVSRVSSVAASAPLSRWPDPMLAAQAALSWVTPEALNAFSLAGAFCVVAGSMVSALGSRKPCGLLELLDQAAPAELVHLLQDPLLAFAHVGPG